MLTVLAGVLPSVGVNKLVTVLHDPFVLVYAAVLFVVEQALRLLPPFWQ